MEDRVLFGEEIAVRLVRITKSMVEAAFVEFTSMAVNCLEGCGVGYGVAIRS